MSDDPIFRSADRADDYVERDAPPPAQQVSPPIVYDDAPSRRSRRHEKREPITEVPTQQQAPEPAPAVEEELSALVDVAAMSQDLSGSWLTKSENVPGSTPQSHRATQGWRGGLAKLGLPVKPGKAELEKMEHDRRLALAETVVRQATWTRCVTILVAQRKGGVGKTPVSVLLGGTLAHIRGGGVVIPEVSDDPGMIALRAEGSPKRGLGELVVDAHSVTSAGQLAGYTAPQTSHAAVIGSPTPRALLTEDAVKEVHALLSSYYAIQVLDSGNVYGSDAFNAALEMTDALVIPVTDAADSMQDALALVHHLSQTEHGQRLIRSATVLRLRYVDASDTVVQRVDAVLDGLGIGRVVDIPYDAHIAEHGELSLGRLQPETRAAFLAAAADVVTSLQTLTTR